MIRLYLDCKCVFVTGFLTDEELMTGRTYCPSHTYTDAYGKTRESHVKIRKAYELKVHTTRGPHYKTNPYWDEYTRVYPPRIVEKAKTVEDQLETR